MKVELKNGYSVQDYAISGFTNNVFIIRFIKDYFSF